MQKPNWNLVLFTVVMALIFLSCAAPDRDCMPLESRESLAGLLGAVPGESRDIHVIVIVPGSTRDGRLVDHDLWQEKTIRFLSELFGGATLVEGVGGWVDEEAGGALIREDISLVEVFIRQKDWTRKNIRKLRIFIHSLGRETEQGEVGVIVNGRYYAIREYDEQ